MADFNFDEDDREEERPSVLYSGHIHENTHTHNYLSALPTKSKYFNEAVPVEFQGPPALIREVITTHRHLRVRLRELEKLNVNSDQIVLFFVGTPDKNGRSWHANCNTIERAVNFMLKKLQIGGFYLKVHVGDRDEWMDADNPFKKDPKIELIGIPTLWVWDSSKRIAGKRCHDFESMYLLLKD